MDISEVYAKYVKPRNDLSLAMFEPRTRTIREGQLVRVVTKTSDWGNVNTTYEFVGVVTAINSEAEKVSVLPMCGIPGAVDRPVLGGSRTSIAQLLDYPEPQRLHTRLTKCDPITFSRRSCTILSIDELGANREWMETAMRRWAQVRVRVRLGSRMPWVDRLAALTPAALLRDHEGNAVRHVRSFTRSPTRWKEYKDAYKYDSDYFKRTLALELSAIKTNYANSPATMFSSRFGNENRIAPVNINDMGVSAQRVLRKLDSLGYRFAACGHAVHGTEPLSVVFVRNAGNVSVCQHCARTQFKEIVIGQIGEMLRVSVFFMNNYAYEWADGTYHTHSEPEVINSYHSSKSKFRKLPNLDGSAHNGVFIGMELEMEGKRKNEQANVPTNLYAHKVLAAATAAMASIKQPQRTYCFLERDGSVNNGFEMVTNPAPPDVHRAIIMKMFGADEQGKLPFAGQLIAHNTSTCGIHVHLTKPETLQHAARLYAFWNNRANEQLITSVARRYGGRYCKTNSENTGEIVDKLGSVARYVKRYSSDVQDSFHDLHNQDRYSIINFCNKHTVEIRAFRGTMMPTTILACMEMAHLSWLFARDAGLTEMHTKQFLEYIERPENAKDSAYLRAYLRMKGILRTKEVNRGKMKRFVAVADSEVV